MSSSWGGTVPPDSKHVSLKDRFVYWVATALFAASWIELLFWSVRTWHGSGLDRRIEVVCLLLLYPLPWASLIARRPIKSVFLCLECYIILQLSLVLLIR